jgi:hybrid cluster-associated redox disulfide protein
MESNTIPIEMILEEVFEMWPATVKVFILHRMACVGCPMARFTTIAEAAKIYNLPLDSFLHELEQVIEH